MEHNLGAEQLLALGRNSFNNNSPGRAFFYYCVVLEASPELKEELKSTFASSLCDWGKILEHEERYNDLFSSYARALELYPENELILNNLGAHLCRLQQPRAAFNYFKSALAINSDYLPAYINLEVTKNILVERWHFRMLNDTVRNEAFKKAISTCVSEGCDSVLDIGSGTGILSIYAKAAGASEVYGCDHSEVMHSISNRVLTTNSLEGSIKFINKTSTDLLIPHDIPERVSLVVTETFDGGLLGEHILQTLIHAWENLLRPQNCKISQLVIPSGGILLIAPIECLSIARKNHILKSDRVTRKSFDIGLDLSQLNVSSKSDEPYDTENLKVINCSYPARAQKLFEFDFNNLNELKGYREGTISKNISFNIENNCYIDALAVWFDLILDKDTTITSSPFAENRCCWEQAVFGLNADLPSSPDWSFSLQASCLNGVLSLSSPEGILLHEVADGRSLHQSLISYLNSESLLLVLAQISENIRPTFRGSPFSILDLSTFPYIGGVLSRKTSSTVVYSNLNNDILNGSRIIVQRLGLSSKNIKPLEWNEVASLMREESAKFNIIIVDVLESTGQLNEEIIGMIPQIRNLLSPNGLFLPIKLEVWCLLAYCEDFVRSSGVTPSADQFRIAEHINEYKVSQMIDFRIQDVQFKRMSENVSLGQIDILEESTKELFLERSIEASSSGSANALIYWFSCLYSDALSFSSSSTDSHVNNAAALFEYPISTEVGTKLTIKLQYNSGGMRFFCK